MHPRHLDAQQTLVELITALRAAANVKDGYEFQQELLARVLEVEEDRNAFSRAVKRMRTGKAPQADAPEPRSDLDPAHIETWQLELDVCERLAREYRCVGDALAWRVFGFQRRNIIALCQNAPPGVMAGKAGLQAELQCVDQAYLEDGQFAILHDLTNCLRIGDVSVFGNEDNSYKTLEIKSDPQKRRTTQNQRIRAAEDAIRKGGPLPGKDRRARLYALDIPFKTHLDLLRIGTERAARDGIFIARVPGARALMVSDMYGCATQGWTVDQFIERQGRSLTTVHRRAGIGTDPDWHITATSLDSVSRDPQRVPFASYPLHPIACARLIGDLAVFTVQTSGPALTEALRNLGFEARWTRPPGVADLAPGEVIMELSATLIGPVIWNVRMDLNRTLQVRRSAIDRYLIETVELGVWAASKRQLLADHQTDRRPWTTYMDEEQTWV